MINLGKVLEAYRRIYRHSMREMASKIGVAYWRVEKGHMMDGETLLKIYNWLGQ